jgi:hypothetical protein
MLTRLPLNSSCCSNWPWIQKSPASVSRMLITGVHYHAWQHEMIISDSKPRMDKEKSTVKSWIMSGVCQCNKSNLIEYFFVCVFLGNWQHSSSWGLLSCSGTCQYIAKNSTRRDPYISDETTFSGGIASSLQYPHVPTYMCDKLAKTPAKATR